MRNLRYVIIFAVALAGSMAMSSASAFGQLKVAKGMSGSGGTDTSSTADSSEMLVALDTAFYLFI